MSKVPTQRERSLVDLVVSSPAAHALNERDGVWHTKRTKSDCYPKCVCFDVVLC